MTILIIVLRQAEREAVSSIVVLKTLDSNTQIDSYITSLPNVDFPEGEPGVSCELHVDVYVINVIIFFSSVILISGIDVQLKCLL